MKRLVLVVLAATAAVFVVDRVALAVNATTARTSAAPYVSPAPMAPKRPTKVTLPGAGFACAQVVSADGGSNPGQCLRLSCTVDCEYDVGVYLVDGGAQLQPYPDAGGVYNATADSNQLPAATPESLCMPYSYDAICVYSAAAGSAYVAPRYP